MESCVVCSTKEAAYLQQNKNTDLPLISKLKVCIPEVDWDAEDCFCAPCVNKVDNFYIFKNICIQSHLHQKEKLKCLVKTSLQEPYVVDVKEDNDSVCDLICKEVAYSPEDTKPETLQELPSSAVLICNICHKKFSESDLLKIHIEEDHSLTFKGIPSGNRIASDRDTIDTLSEINKERCSYKICDKSDISGIILKKRDKKCTGKGSNAVNKYLCANCSKLFVHKRELRNHLTTCGVENICKSYKTCRKRAKTNLSESATNDKKRPPKSSESKGRKPVRTYSCEVCGIFFPFAKDVINHAVNDHKMDTRSIKPYSCDICQMRFSCCANLIQHKKYHDRNRTHVCPFCGKSFITKSDLIVHEHTHYNRRNYKCDICAKAFNTNKTLRTHKLVCHTNSSLWKYACEMCGRRFPMKSGFDQHMKRHLGDKKFSCQICEKAFISYSELKKHKIFHSNVRAYKCSTCGKEYKEKKVYEVHLAKVHGIGDVKIPVRVKKYTCHVCGNMFADRQKLERHMCTHTGLKPYPCDMCFKKFTDKSYLKHHKKTVHGVTFLADLNR